MDEAQVIQAVDAELERSESFMDTRIAHERKLAYDYYHGRPFGNEKDGRSQIVSADVAQAVDGAVPAIVKIFVSGDKAVEFTPREANDVKGAEQATIAANYVFFTQNNGFGLAHDFIKDGLLQKTGCFKWKWDKSITQSEKRLQGLTDQEFEMAGKAPDWEMVEHTAYPDPMAQQAAQMSPPGVNVPPQLPQLHDITVRIKKEAGKVKIMVPPPEDIKISPDSEGLDVMDMPFIAHTPLLTASDLAEMGITKEVIATLTKADDDHTDEEKTGREERNDAGVGLQESGTQALYRYEECYLRLDEDDDGIAELRKVCKVGKTIVHDEPVDHIPLAIWTPKVMPHEVVGVSLADDVMDLQLLKSTLWRGAADSLYQSIAPRMFVQGDVNMDDVLTIKPGGVIRGGPGSNLTPITIPFVGQQVFPMLEYTDQEKDARVGFSSMGPGMDPDSINKTATFVREMANQTSARAELIARNAAEYGFKPLFKGIMYLLGKHQQKPLVVRLTNDFQAIDPEVWNKEYDMSCNVGLGIGSRDQQLMHLQALGMDLQAIAQSPFAQLLLGPDKIYNYVEKKANLMGFKDATVFVNKPVNPDGTPMQPPPPPKPESVQVAEIKAQGEQQKMQADTQAEGQKLQQEAGLEQMKTQEQMKLEMFKAAQAKDLEIFKAQLAQQTEIEKARISANAQVRSTVKAETGEDPDDEQVIARRQQDEELVSRRDQVSEATAMALTQLVQQMAQKRPYKVIRGTDGKVSELQ